MPSLTYLTKKLDQFSGEEGGTLVGGLIAVGCYTIVLITLIVYIATSMEAQYPTKTSVGIFPNDAASALLMPPMKCVASSGCWITAQKGLSVVLDDAKLNSCLHLQQGEALPENYRRMYYSADPVEFFTVLSKEEDENFALSYDVTQVTGYSSTLATSTIKAATDFTPSIPMPYKIYRGMSLMNIVSTTGLDQDVDTWTNTILSEISSFDGTGGCCGAIVYDKNGGNLGTLTLADCAANSNSGDNWWQTKLVPPTTYTKITVEDPLNPVSVLGLIGGWLGIMVTVGGAAFFTYAEIKLVCGSEPSNVQAKAASAPAQHEKISEIEIEQQ